MTRILDLVLVSAITLRGVLKSLIHCPGDLGICAVLLMIQTLVHSMYLERVAIHSVQNPDVGRGLLASIP